MTIGSLCRSEFSKIGSDEHCRVQMAPSKSLWMEGIHMYYKFIHRHSTLRCKLNTETTFYLKQPFNILYSKKLVFDICINFLKFCSRNLKMIKNISYKKSTAFKADIYIHLRTRNLRTMQPNSMIAFIISSEMDLLIIII